MMWIFSENFLGVEELPPGLDPWPPPIGVDSDMVVRLAHDRRAAAGITNTITKNNISRVYNTCYKIRIDFIYTTESCVGSICRFRFTENACDISIS